MAPTYHGRDCKALPGDGLGCLRGVANAVKLYALLGLTLAPLAWLWWVTP